MEKIIFKEPSLSASDYLSKIKPQALWHKSDKFHSRHRLITSEGFCVQHGNYAPRFELIEKWECSLTLKERIIRLIKTIFLQLEQKKYQLYFKKVKKLLFKRSQSIHFALKTSTDPFIKDTNLHTPLQRKISEKTMKSAFLIHNSVVDDLLKNFEAILKKEDSKQLFFYPSQDCHRVFSLVEYPLWIFKINLNPNPSYSIKNRYEQILEAETIIRTYNYKHLKIPRCQLINLEFQNSKYDVLIEEKLEFDDSLKFQKQAFTSSDPQTQEALCELAVFICKSGYSDLAYRNNPILKTSSERCQIGLIDLEHFESSPWGLCGTDQYNLNRKGLLSLCNTQMQKRIYEIAKKEGLFGDVDDTTQFHYKNSRNLEIFQKTCEKYAEEEQKEEKIYSFYNQLGITTASQFSDKSHLLDHEFIHSFSSCYSSQKQCSYAKQISQIIKNSLQTSCPFLPLHLSRMVPLELDETNTSFKSFLIAYLKELKKQNFIFDFKQDEKNPAIFVIQC